MNPVTIPKRPRGITVVTILLALQGLLELTLASMVLSGAVAPRQGMGEASLALGFFILLLAWGVWRLKHWAFWGVLLLQPITLAAAAVHLFETHLSLEIMVLLALGDLLIPTVVLLSFWRDRHSRTLLRL